MRQQVSNSAHLLLVSSATHGRAGPPHPHLRYEVFSMLSPLSHLPIDIPKHLDECVCASPLLLAEGARYEGCCPSLMCVWHSKSSHLPASGAHLKSNRHLPSKQLLAFSWNRRALLFLIDSIISALKCWHTDFSCLQEALSVVSEDQSLFECAYGSPHLAKTEMTASSSSEYGQTSKMSPRVPQQDWLSQPPARVTIKMECNPNQVNGSR